MEKRGAKRIAHSGRKRQSAQRIARSGGRRQTAELKLQCGRISLAGMLLCAILFALCPLGCGYQIHNKASLPFAAIAIGRIENKTVEPKLEDRLYRALTEEFLKQGVDVSPGATYKIAGAVHQFDLRVLSEKSDVAVDYEVTVKADFTLTDPSGTTKEFKNIESPFIISFSGSGALNDLLTSRELAAERAIRDMAMEIVAGLIYR